MNNMSGGNKPDTSARNRWVAPPRPEWVLKVNEEGEAMDLKAVVPLDPDSLIASAKKATGLSNFGDEDWRTPFEILCKSLDDDADLNLFGRIRMRSDILNLLTARLGIEEAYRQHPEIEDVQIEHPVFIVGQGRTGTSYLLNLLNSIPENGGFLMWEGMFPYPPPEKETYATDERIARADKLLTMGNRVTPALFGLHEFAAELPQEDGNLLGMAFRHIGWFNVMAQVAQYNQYMMTADMECAYRYMNRVLKVMGWKNPRKQWVLKDPTHLELIPTVLKVWPDACFVWTHRDPTKAVASTIGLIGTMISGRTDHPFKGSSMDDYMDPFMAAQRLNGVIDQLENGEIPRDRLCSVQYLDLVNEPIAVAQKIHDYFGLSFPPESRAIMEAYVRSNPRENRPKHQYSDAAKAELAPARAAFKRYQDYFGVATED